MNTMRPIPCKSKKEPRGYCFDAGDERYHPTRSYFESWPARIAIYLPDGSSGWQANPEEYDEPAVMYPDWPGEEPVWAGYCNTCLWRYEGPQSIAILKFKKHSTSNCHGLTYIHLGTCWHAFN